LVKVFLDYYRAGTVFGLFLSSGVIGNPDTTMERLTAVASVLRKREQFKGYIHLKIIPGASDESDREIVTWSWGLYRRLGLRRVYFNAYQRGLGDPGIPGERSQSAGGDLLAREHRLYQADWLIRKYGFEASELPFESNGNFSLEVDPKERWARMHPERFPIDINRADKMQLLRVPGIGERSVARILAMRKDGGRVRDLGQVGLRGKWLERAKSFVCV
jgi:predicted DNA-binding helix-hairpin-helix protein